nr:hypothetical protein [Tanacetum cinerariifolium]
MLIAAMFISDVNLKEEMIFGFTNGRDFVGLLLKFDSNKFEVLCLSGGGGVVAFSIEILDVVEAWWGQRWWCGGVLDCDGLKRYKNKVVVVVVSVLVLRFAAAFWFCILLIEDSYCVLPREDSASFKTWLRFVSRLCCILSRRLPAFCLKTSAFCLKTGLRFVSRPPAFCLKIYCILSPDRTDFASWQQRIRLYCRGKENGVNILKSIDEGPYQMGTVWETLAEGTEGAPQFGLERPRVYSGLSPEEKDRYNADIRAINILLQGLPKDIYTLVNYYTDAKDIWDNHKGESIHYYYVQFAKLINDMMNIKITMSRMQLNSKFMNNMLPEWGRFVTAVKLNRGPRDSNYDKLYAYLKQHETHAKKNKMMLERFSQNTVDPLTLMSNVSNPQRYSPSSSTSSSTQGGGAAGYGGAQNRVGNVNPGQARPVKCYNCNGAGHIARNCTQPKRPQNSEYYKDKMLLMQAQENGVALDTEQLLFLAGGQDNAFDDDVDEQPVQDLALNVDNVFQADDCDAFDFDVDEAPTAQTMFLANLSSADLVTDEARPSYDLDILSDVEDRLLKQDQSLQTVHMLCRPKPYYNELNKVAIGYKNPLCLIRAKQVQAALYNGHEIIKDNHAPAIVHNTEDTLEIAEITRKKMNDKMKDPECVTRKVKIAPLDYSKENFLAIFTPQKQLTPEQIFWSQDLIKLKSEALKE